MRCYRRRKDVRTLREIFDVMMNAFGVHCAYIDWVDGHFESLGARG